MAIRAEDLNSKAKLSTSDRISGPARNTLLERLVEGGALYIPEALTGPQFATLHSVVTRLIAQPKEAPIRLAARIDAALASGSTASLAPRSQALPLGLNAIDTLARTRAGYAFADLTPEIQDAMLDYIAAGDLTTDHLNLALWLGDIRSSALTRPSVAA